MIRSTRKPVIKSSKSYPKNYLRILKNDNNTKRITRLTGLRVNLPYDALDIIEKEYREKRKLLNQSKKDDLSDDDIEYDNLSNIENDVLMSNIDIEHDVLMSDNDIEYDNISEDEVKYVKTVKPKKVIYDSDDDDDFKNPNLLKKNQNKPLMGSIPHIYKNETKKKKVEEIPIAKRREKREVKKPEVLDPSHKQTQKSTSKKVSTPKKVSESKKESIENEYKGLKLNKKCFNSEYFRILKVQKNCCNLCKCEIEEYDDTEIDHIVQQQKFYEDLYGKDMIQSMYNKHILCHSCHKSFKSGDVDMIANKMLKEKNPILSNFLDFRNFILNKLSDKFNEVKEYKNYMNNHINTQTIQQPQNISQSLFMNHQPMFMPQQQPMFIPPQSLFMNHQPMYMPQQPMYMPQHPYYQR